MMKAASQRAGGKEEPRADKIINYKFFDGKGIREKKWKSRCVKSRKRTSHHHLVLQYFSTQQPSTKETLLQILFSEVFYYNILLCIGKIQKETVS
jgi:hypothetical protein